MNFLDVFNLALNLQYSRFAAFHGYTVKGEGRILDNLKEVCLSLETAEFEAGLMKEIQGLITRLQRTYKKDEIINSKEGKEVYELLSRARDRIRNELVRRPCIELYGKGALNQEELLKTSAGEPNAFFGEQVWKDLPAIAKSDFSDSAKCLLTQASTPAAMVALRGVESVVRRYYSLKSGQECAKKALGVIVRELRKFPDVNTRLLGYIDYIRSEKRNLAQHPDKVFTQREAERIFMEIINAVHDIYAEILSP